MISLLCPTRGHPAGVAAMVASALATSTNSDALEFVFRIDEDDELGADSLHQLFRFRSWPRTHVVWGKRGALSDMWNDCWRVATGPVFMLCADDILFRTPGWDTMVQDMFDTFPDRIVYVFGDDKVVKPPDKFGTHGFLHENWCDAVGHFVPPGFPCDFVDSWLNTVAGNLNRRRYVPMVTEHVHPSTGARQADSVFHFRRQQFSAALKKWDGSGDGLQRDEAVLRRLLASWS